MFEELQDRPDDNRIDEKVSSMFSSEDMQVVKVMVKPSSRPWPNKAWPQIPAFSARC